MTKNPVVTVLMPTYNTKKEYLKEAIDSILSQTYKDFEFLIIDDGSTDNTEEIIKAYTDKRIRYVKNEKNLGLIKTLNRGLDLANGEYIARMDSDDISLPDRLKKQVEYLDAHPDVSLIGTEIEFFPNYYYCGFLEEPSLFDMIKSNRFAHPTVMFKKADFEKHNLRYDENYPHAEDYELWSRAVCVLKCQNIKEVLLKYRWHAENISNKNKNVQLQTVEKIKKRLINLCTKDKIEQEYLIKLINHQYEDINSEMKNTETCSSKVTWKLFGVLPLLQIKHKKNKTKFLLFKFLPLLSIKRK